MGAAFISQQYLQNVLGYSTIEAGAAILPAGHLHDHRRAALGQARGLERVSPHAPHAASALIFLAFLWHVPALEGGHARTGRSPSPTSLLGAGVGLAGTPSSNSLTGSVPVTRVGMASGTADLQRDLGGALMTSIFGALLTAGYASAMGTAIDESGRNITEKTQSAAPALVLERGKPRRRAPEVRGPDHRSRAVGRSSTGTSGPTSAAMVAVLIGMALVFRFFPKKEEELQLRAAYHAARQRAACRRRSAVTIQEPRPAAPREL